MNEPIKLSIAATSKRVDIANVVALTFLQQRPAAAPVAAGRRHGLARFGARRHGPGNPGGQEEI